jgi:hypothetical protein
MHLVRRSHQLRRRELRGQEFPKSIADHKDKLIPWGDDPGRSLHRLHRPPCQVMVISKPTPHRRVLRREYEGGERREEAQGRRRGRETTHTHTRRSYSAGPVRPTRRASNGPDLARPVRDARVSRTASYSIAREEEGGTRMRHAARIGGIAAARACPIPFSPAPTRAALRHTARVRACVSKCLRAFVCVFV